MIQAQAHLGYSIGSLFASLDSVNKSFDPKTKKRCEPIKIIYFYKSKDCFFRERKEE